jgi:hypothetical protein
LPDKITNLRHCGLFASILETLQGPQPWTHPADGQIRFGPGPHARYKGLRLPSTTQRCRSHISIFLLGSYRVALNRQQHMLETSTVHEDERKRKARVGCSRERTPRCKFYEPLMCHGSRCSRSGLQEASPTSETAAKRLFFHGHAVRHRKRRVTGDNKMGRMTIIWKQGIRSKGNLRPGFGLVSWPKAHP